MEKSKQVGYGGDLTPDPTELFQASIWSPCYDGVGNVGSFPGSSSLQTETPEPSLDYANMFLPIIWSQSFDGVDNGGSFPGSSSLQTETPEPSSDYADIFRSSIWSPSFDGVGNGGSFPGSSTLQTDTPEHSLDYANMFRSNSWSRSFDGGGNGGSFPGSSSLQTETSVYSLDYINNFSNYEQAGPFGQRPASDLVPDRERSSWHTASGRRPGAETSFRNFMTNSVDLSDYNLRVGPRISYQLQSFVSNRNPRPARPVKGIFSEVFPGLCEYMTSKHYHSRFIRMVDSCNQIQLTWIVGKVTSDPDWFVNASRTMPGSRSIQKLIQVVKNSTLIDDILVILDDKFCLLMKDKTAHSIVLQCNCVLDGQERTVLYGAALRHCIELAEHEHGYLSLINFMISMLDGELKNRLLFMISNSAVSLAQNPWGNFVLQHVLELHIPVFCRHICSLLRGQYKQLSLQDSGSYVVEKCLQCPGWYPIIITELLQDHQFWLLAMHRYGNYVIQCALRITKEDNSPLHQRLVRHLLPHAWALQMTRHGRPVVRLIKQCQRI